MGFFIPDVIQYRLKEVENLLKVNNNAGILMYKLDAGGPKYEPYLTACKGIKEVMMYHNGSTRARPYDSDFYYCEKLKTKFSTVTKSLNSESYIFFTRKEAEDAFKSMQKESVSYLEKRVAYFKDLQDRAKQMSV